VGKLQLKGEWLEKFPAGRLEAPGTQSKVGRMLPALSSACKRNASISEFQFFLPSYNLLQAAT